MTEKRFNMNKSGDLYDKNNLLMLDFGYSYDGVGCKRIIDLLNDLNDDNEQLKHRIKKLQNKNELEDNELRNYSEIFNELNGLIDENEQLKSEIQELKNVHLSLLRDKFKGYFGLQKHNAKTLSEIAIVEKFQNDIYNILKEVYDEY